MATQKQNWYLVIARVFLALSLFWSLQTWAQFVPKDLAIYVDHAGQETIETIRAMPDARFTSSPAGLSEGYSRSAFWLRFTAQAPQGQGEDWWLEIQPPYLEDVRFYAPDPIHADRMVERRSGSLVPLQQRELPYRAYVFRQALREGKPQVFYLRIQTQSPSLALVKFWPVRKFAEALPLEYSVQGGFFVLLGVILFINLLLWSSFREPIYLTFMVYLVSVFLSTFTHQGLASQFFTSVEPVYINALRSYSQLLISAAAGNLYRSILLIGPEQKWLNFLFRALTFVPLACMPLVAAGHFTEVMRGLSPFLLFMTITALYRCWQLFRQRVTGYSFLILATFFSLGGLLFTVAQVSGLLPGNPIAIYSLQFSALGNIIALHLVIIARSVKQEASRQKAVQAARDAEARAQQENLARQEQASFISMLAHELKTPLAGIGQALDNAEILLGQIGADVATRFNRIRRALKRINHVSERYLQMDRGDSAVLRPNIQFVQLSAVVETAVQHFPAALERLRVHPYENINIRADADLLSIALINLIDNAAKYSPAHLEVDLWIHVEAARYLIIDVADQGAGIPAQRRAMIFQRYYRAPEHATVPGIGVGLALVQRIALLHGGNVQVLDRSGYGAVFRLTVPLHPD